MAHVRRKFYDLQVAHKSPDPARQTGRADFPHQMFSTTFDAQCGEVKDVAKFFQALGPQDTGSQLGHIIWGRPSYSEFKNAIRSRSFRQTAFSSDGVRPGSVTAQVARALAFISRSTLA
jgi:hypothetical protein